MEGTTRSRLSLPIRIAVVLAACMPALHAGAAVAETPPAGGADGFVHLDPNRTGGLPGWFVLDPPTPSGIGIHVNMPIIRGNTYGWERFEEIVGIARAGGFYLLLNNIDRARNGQLVAATFDRWTYHELTRFASILAGTQVPVRLYVGAIEHEDDEVAVGIDRLVSWRDDVQWVHQITGAKAGIIVDASVMGDPNGAPDGRTRLAWFTDYGRAMTAHAIEVGFEAIRRDNQNRPLEDRRYYSLLQNILTHYSQLPSSADLDARIMSTVDHIPPAKDPLVNTIWLENDTWDELADGDHIPQAWLDAWNITPDQLQHEVVVRLYAKGFGLILPPEVFDAD